MGFFMADITDSDMLDTTTLLMDMLPTMARDLLMPSLKLMLILIFSMEDTTESDMLDTIILPTDMLLIMARDLLMLNPMCIADTMDSVDTVVSWIWIWTSCLLWISRESPHIESDSTTIFVFSICDQNFSA